MYSTFVWPTPHFDLRPSWHLIAVWSDTANKMGGAGISTGAGPV